MGRDDRGHDDRWLLLDIEGKTPAHPARPALGQTAPHRWLAEIGISDGPSFRILRKGGTLGPAEPVSEDLIYTLVPRSGAAIGYPDLTPHDLRRTCAKLFREAGGGLEQIQLLLGHASIQTTERYLGTKQDLLQAVNDRVKIQREGE